MYSEKFYMTVVKYLGKTTKNGLTQFKLYGVETDEDLVEEAIYNDFGSITVWDDKGHLHEIEEGEYEVVSDAKWFSVVPEQRYIEYN